MARDLKLNVDGNSAGGQRALEEVAAASAAAAHEADRMAAQFRQAQNDAAKLDRQLAETAVTARALARELSKNPADATIKAQLDAQKKAGAELKRLRADVVGDTEKAAKDAAKFAQQAANDLKKATTIVNPGEGFSFGSVLPAAGGIAAGPALAAGGGLLAGLAGAGAAGIGVAGAVLGNPKLFQAAWSSALAGVKKDFFDASAPFTGVTLDAIRTIGPTIASWNIAGALAPAAKYVPLLVQGVEGFATGIVHGFSDLVAKAGPAVSVLSAGLKNLGDAGGAALSHIADGAEGGAQALHDVLVAVDGIVEGFGYVVEAAEKAYQFVHDHPIEATIATGGLAGGAALVESVLGNTSNTTSKLTLTTKGLQEQVEKAGHAFNAEVGDLTNLQQHLNDVKVTTDTFAGALSDKAFNSLLAADHATLSWAESLTGLSDSFKQNGTQLDIHTAKGQANREAILSAVSANIKQYDTNIAAGQSATQAASAYDANTAALEKQLRKAGLTQGQIDGLIATYAKVPDSVNTNIAIQGLTNAINDLDDTLAALNHIDGYVAHAKVVVDQQYIGNRQSQYDQQVPHVGGSGGGSPSGGSKKKQSYNAMGSIRHAADGMVIPPSDPGTLIVGEPPTGGELWMPLAGIGRPRAQSLLQSAASGYGLNVTPRIPQGLFGSNSGGSAGTFRMVYDGPSDGLNGMFATWLAAQSRAGNLRIHSGAIVN